VCYTFNFVGSGKINSSDPVSAVFTGAEHGLVLEIDIEGELSPVERWLLAVLPDGIDQFKPMIMLRNHHLLLY
jgi:hypothetical protein